ncbi:MAG: FRG domain-containing protein [Campylobacterota bacterium]|nr:FRG domain-containing protein [Campylobacterota bacterium]
MFTNNEQLTAMNRGDGKIVFKSGTEMTFNQYRGQTKNYNLRCGANIYRTKDLQDSFLEVCRTVSFERFLQKHPFIQFINSIEDDIYVNKTAIAQHYELKTPYIDITSNFDVASFFATCEQKNGKYKPYKGKEYGVMYVYDEVLDRASSQEESFDFEYIGWQPLPRPEQQRASTYKLQQNENFAMKKYVKSYLFNHSRSQSKDIWLKFDKGKILFPKDSTKDIADMFKKTTSFTKDEILEAKERFSLWFKNYDISELEKIIDNVDCDSNSKNINWCDFLECDKNYWEKEYVRIMEKVRYRNIAYA